MAFLLASEAQAFPHRLGSIHIHGVRVFRSGGVLITPTAPGDILGRVRTRRTGSFLPCLRPVPVLLVVYRLLAYLCFFEGFRPFEPIVA